MLPLIIVSSMSYNSWLSGYFQTDSNEVKAFLLKLIFCFEEMKSMRELFYYKESYGLMGAFDGSFFIFSSIS